MDKKFLKNITVIIILYKTPLNQLSKLSQYKNFKIILLDQCGTSSSKMNIKKFIESDFDYYSTKKNLGLSKAANFLLSKVRTKFCLFTQMDVAIDSYSVFLLQLSLLKKNSYIFAGPKYIKKLDTKINLLSKFSLPERIKIKKVESIDASCFLFNVEKVREIGFFDEDFFLYWEDIFLMKMINKTKYKIIYVDKAVAVHEMGRSTEINYKIILVRNMNFKFGEYLFDYKMSQFRFIKILRNIIKLPFFITFFLLTFQFLKSYIKLSEFLGTIKFINFYLSNNKIKKLDV